ncbi:MAG: hypothetical protein R2854_00595 [Caldilineaceae bacterium]
MSGGTGHIWQAALDGELPAAPTVVERWSGATTGLSAPVVAGNSANFMTVWAVDTSNAGILRPFQQRRDAGQLLRDVEPNCLKSGGRVGRRQLSGFLERRERIPARQAERGNRRRGPTRLPRRRLRVARCRRPRYRAANRLRSV